MKKYFGLIFFFTVLSGSAMEREKFKEVPRLTKLSADVIAQQLVESILQKNDISWFFKVALPRETENFIQSSLIKYFGNYYWKKLAGQSLIKSLNTMSPISRVVISSDGNFIVIEHPASLQGDIPEILDIKNGEWLNHLSEEYKVILEATKKSLPNNFVESPDSSYKVVHFTNDFGTTTLEIRDIKTNKPLFTGKNFQGLVRSIMITPDSNLILIRYSAVNKKFVGMDVVTYHEDKVFVVNARTGKTLHDFKRPTSLKHGRLNLSIQSAKMTQDGTMLVVGYGHAHGTTPFKIQDKGFIDLFDVKSGALLHSFDSTILETGDALIKSLAISPNNSFIVVGYENGQIRIISIEPIVLNMNEVVQELYIGNKIEPQDQKKCVIS